MTFGNSQNVVPEGQNENSPAFQRREGSWRFRVPKGRLNPTHRLEDFSRPFGTDSAVGLVPALKRRAIFVKSLRDSLRRANPESRKAL